MRIAHIDNFPCIITVELDHWYYGSDCHIVCIEATFEEVTDDEFDSNLCKALWNEFNHYNIYSDMVIKIQHPNLPKDIVLEWDICKQVGRD